MQIFEGLCIDGPHAGMFLSDHSAQTVRIVPEGPSAPGYPLNYQRITYRHWQHDFGDAAMRGFWVSNPTIIDRRSFLDYAISRLVAGFIKGSRP